MHDSMVSRMLQESNSVTIDTIYLADESLEVAVVLNTGEVVLYRLKPESEEPPLYRQVPDQELAILEHIPRFSGQRFSSYYLLAPHRGRLSACAISDVGKFYHSTLSDSLHQVTIRFSRYCIHGWIHVHSGQSRSTGHPSPWVD